MMNMKIIQGTIVYELLLDSSKFSHIYNLDKYERADYTSLFITEYKRILNYSEQCLLDEYSDLDGLMNYIAGVRQLINEVKDIINDKEYLIVLMGSSSMLKVQIPILAQYGYKVDKIWSKENIIIPDNMKTTLKKIEQYNHVAFLVSGDAKEYIDIVYRLSLKEAHLFILEELALHL